MPEPMPGSVRTEGLMESEYPNLAKLEARGHWGIKRGLENPLALREGMGFPDQSFPVVLIAGTNGKGSTGAFLAHALKAAGLVVGWTTSPHLLSPTERIWVDGRPIGLGALELLLGEAFDCEVRKGITATYFELMITAALLAFRMTGVEVALVEVGMGGRWDATNALDPLLTVLTTVGLDHTQYLGDTREAIGREKLCTARTGRSLVLGPGLEPEWITPLLECAPRLVPAEPLWADRLAWDHTVVQGHRIGLAGAHQLENLATAWTALRELRKLGFPLEEASLWRGLGETRWPGRFWEVPGLDRVWMDGAHNPDGARVLAQHVECCGIHPHLFFGAMGDKDLSGVVAELRSLRPASVTLVCGENERYATAEQLRAAWGAECPVLSVPQAAQRLRQTEVRPRLVTGSLFLMGDLLRELGIDPYAGTPPDR